MVNIKGVIGNDAGEMNLPRIIEQVQNENGNSIYIAIDSIGGDLEEAFRIYNYLKSLDKPITTECMNNCASAASVVFLAGDVRIAGCPIMIHNPYIRNVSGDSATLRNAADWIESYERRAEQVYAERTKLDQATLSSLMECETYIAPAQAVSFGFATEAKQIALAKLDKSTFNKNEKKMSRREKGLSQLIRQALGGRNHFVAYGMDLTTADGQVVTIDREEGKPQVGDKASPDGTFTMPDGMVIIVKGGVITEITEASNEAGAPLPDDVAKEIAAIVEEMQAQIDALKAELDMTKEKTTEEMRILNAVKMAGGADKVFKRFSGVYKPQARVGVRGKQEAQRSSSVAQRLADEKQKRGIN